MALQYLTVRIGGMWYGIPLTAIIEVIHMVALAELPETESDVLGLLTLRDQIMPVVDLRLRFHQSNTNLSLNTPIVAVRAENHDLMMGFVVDEVDSVTVLDTDTPIKATNSPYLAGAVQLEAFMLLILDIPSFFGSSNLDRTNEVLLTVGE
ncbi:MAG TPA: chemotaxis protein CheW [Phototrophicaceae bacterium]|jgi:purine-binding chemotaxis protein CheW|nr:chemotaxis protein CheW [Phototrophicaceae bacterium]